MTNFTYQRAETADNAIRLIGQQPTAKFLGGGTNLVDLMRENVEQPATLIDVTQLSNQLEKTAEGGVHIGAAATNSAVANHPLIRERYPLLAQAILNGASGQIRNMATVGGNLLQRTRCYYFYDDAARCNKRTPNAGCDALWGFNRIHAILGTEAVDPYAGCIATHPSDMCVALAALDATVVIEGTNGRRIIPFIDFHRLPGDTPQLETNLQVGELITAVELPNLPFATHSLYRKVRDRSSYAFALVSVAGLLEVSDHQIKHVRLALGGVAHKPWRAVEAEKVLLNAPATDETFRTAAEAELKAAKGFAHNHFKIELAKRLIVNVLQELTLNRVAS